MVDQIQLQTLKPVELTELKPAAMAQPQSDQGVSFQELLEQSLREVNERQHVAAEKIQGLVAGEVTDLHQVMVAVEEAHVAFNFTMQVRNKLVEAYQELMRMQV